MALTFLPVFLPWNCIDPTNLSTIGQSAFLNFLAWYLPAVWGTKTCDLVDLTAI
jgi:hypothetical protein